MKTLFIAVSLIFTALTCPAPVTPDKIPILNKSAPVPVASVNTDKHCDRCCCMYKFRDCDHDCYQLKTMKESSETAKPCNNRFIARLKEAQQICEGYKHDEVALNKLCVKMCVLKVLLEKKGIRITRHGVH